jgi:hypothetical protein
MLLGFSKKAVKKLTLIVRTGFMFLILLYTTTDYPNSYVDINVILPAIREEGALSCRWSDRKMV